MDLFNPTRWKSPAKMDIYQRENEDDINYRLRIWQSTELWDFLKLEWDENDMPNEMTTKMLRNKKYVYGLTVEEIDEEVERMVDYMKSQDFRSAPHYYVWTQMYIKHLTDRKNEMKMEEAMKTFMI